MIAAASVDFSELVALWDRLAADTVLGGIGSELERVDAFVKDAQAWELAQLAVHTAQNTVRSVGGGTITQAQFEALGICEQGGRDNPYYGRYSIIDGSSGGKSMAEQQAMAQAIYDRAGARAWDGCAYTLGG